MEGARAATHMLEDRMAARFRSALAQRGAEAFITDFGYAIYHHTDSTDWAIEVSTAVRHLGIPRLELAKGLIRNNLSEGVDYQGMWMSVSAFKKLSELVPTDEALLVNDYFRVMERAMNQYVYIKEQEQLIKKRQDDLKAELEYQPQDLACTVRDGKRKFVYINKAASEWDNNTHKMGRTGCLRRRTQNLNTAHACGTSMVFSVATKHSTLLESASAQFLRAYNTKRNGGQGGREHYNCRIDHTANVISILDAAFSTLDECDSSTPRLDMLQRLSNKITCLASQGDVTQCAPSSKPAALEPAPGPATSTRVQFLDMLDSKRQCIILHSLGAVTLLEDFQARFSRTMRAHGKSGVWKKDFKNDKAFFLERGFILSENKISICKDCKQVAALGCCPDYHRRNTHWKQVFHNMMLTAS